MLAWKAPKDETDATNQWYALMKQRVALEKDVEKAKAQEKLAEAWLTAYYPKYIKRKTELIGAHCFLSLVTFPKVKLEDFDMFMAYVRAGKGKHDDLVYKRAKEETVRDYWKKGEDVPGIISETIIKPSYRSI